MGPKARSLRLPLSMDYAPSVGRVRAVKSPSFTAAFFAKEARSQAEAEAFDPHGWRTRAAVADHWSVSEWRAGWKSNAIVARPMRTYLSTLSADHATRPVLGDDHGVAVSWSQDHRIATKDLDALKAEFARLDAETSKKVLKAYRSRKESAGLEPEPPSTTPCGKILAQCHFTRRTGKAIDYPPDRPGLEVARIVSMPVLPQGVSSKPRGS